MSTETTTEGERRGLMLVLSSPSGAGKTSLSRRLLETENIHLSISVTTRPRRASEVDGVHYHFIDRKTFERMRDAGELLEWAEVHGNFYGSPRKAVDEALAAGRDVLFDIDWQGTRQIRRAAPADLVTVFILPPSMRELRARLKQRAEDSEETIERRLENARIEIQRWVEYDYVLVNRDFEDCVASVRAILVTERLRRSRRPGLEAFVQELLAEKI